MTAVGITVDGQMIHGPATAERIEVALPPELYDLGYDFLLTRCRQCKTPLRQAISGDWLDTLDSDGCAGSVPRMHEPEPVPPVMIRKVIIEIGDLLGVTVHVDGWGFPVTWHITKDGYHKVDQTEHREFRITQPRGTR